jgi:serine/threonine protein kinase
MNTFITMEYIKLDDLAGYIVGEHGSAKSNAQEITKQILERLKSLHKEAICHRDLKLQLIPHRLVLYIVFSSL